MMDSRPNPWRVAFIGAGAIVQRSHIPSFQRLPGVDTVAVCDINQARAELVAEATGISQVFTDHNRMLAKVQPDITVIATPNVFHYPMSMDALGAGSHVLCEKPLALTYAHGLEMAEKAKEVDRILTVGTHYRWSRPMAACKAHVRAGFFGEIYAARTVMNRRAGIPGFGSWFTNKALSGGGSLLDIGVHALDRALFLMDYPQPVTVSGALFSKFGPHGKGLGGWGSDISAPTADVRFDVDDMAWAFVRFATGAVLQFQVSWASNHPEQTVTELFGTDGGARVGNQEGLTLYTTLNGQHATIETDRSTGSVNSYMNLIEDFVRYLNGDPGADIVTMQQALRSIRIVEAIFQSAESGKEIAIEQ